MTDFLSGKADEAIGICIETAVEHPDGVIAPADIFLQHQIRMISVFGKIVEFEQFVF